MDDYDDISEYVQRNYNKLKSRCPNEDIFHDTLIACMRNWDGESSPENYILHSYKVNVIREKQYHRNCKRSDVDIPDSIQDNGIEDGITISQIKELLSNKFGVKLTNMYIEHCKGIPVAQIEKDTGIEGLAYKFKTCKNYLIQAFNKNLI